MSYGPACAPALDCGGGCRTVRAVGAAAAEVAETVYAPMLRIDDHTPIQAQICLVLDGEYEECYRVRCRIEDEFARAPSLDDLARDAGVHHASLARAFRRHYGCTVGAYIRQKRIEFACRALLADAADIATVAYRAGFADQSHFTRTFRRFLGMTPGRFRARRRRG